MKLVNFIKSIIFIARKCFIALCNVHKTDLIEKLTLEKTKEIIFAGIGKNKIETPLSKKISQERWEIFSENYNNDCEIWTYQDFCGYGIAIKSNNRIIKKIELIKE
jgi:hypothetical protein